MTRSRGALRPGAFLTALCLLAGPAHGEDVQARTQLPSRDAHDAVDTLRSALDRAIRAEQRSVRAELREARRAQLAADPRGDTELDGEIAALHGRLERIVAERRSLDIQAASVRDTLDAPASAPSPGNAPTDVDGAVARTVCDHGAAFGSLDDGGRLVVVVRSAGGVHHYAFTMGAVRACEAGNIDADSLLGRAISGAW